MDAAVAVFAYNRAAALRRCLADLDSQIGTLPVYLYCDGPRGLADPGVSQVRNMLEQSEWSDRATVTYRQTNLGLAASVRRGIDEVLTRHEAVVVLEDDIGIGPGFMDYLTAALHTYKDTPGVGSITGFRHPVRSRSLARSRYSGFFLRRFSSWGWGTWRHVWLSLDWSSVPELIDDERFLGRVSAAGPDMLPLVSAYRRGVVTDTWAIPLSVQFIARDLLTLFPRENLIRNYGLSEGTHYKEPPPWSLDWGAVSPPFRFPPVNIDAAAERAYIRWLEGIEHPTLMWRAARRARRIWNPGK